LTHPITELTLTRPDDWHLHLRDGAALQAVVGDSARQFARAVIMPNLRPPVTSAEQAVDYRQRILAALTDDSSFQPLMTLYLTDNTSPGEISRAKNSGVVIAAKLYPAGATTNSDSGVSQLQKIYPALAAMEAHDLPLLVHGEVTDPAVDVFDREKGFIEQQLIPLTRQFPNLKIIFEHITTKDAADFVLASADNIAATITPQHLLLNRNAMLVGGIQPHNYCLPVLKRETHRQALLAAATSGNPKFFLGTDSAPHAKGAKESACGCAGIYSAHAAIEFYATAFEEANALDKLEAFASHFGADFYGLPRNEEPITLARQEHLIADELRFGDETLVPFFAGKTLNWKLL
jgi:dihydroorotase